MTKLLIHEHANEPLDNSLRVHRRKAGLTQHELSQILGYNTYSAVSRHEQVGVPTLVVALSYQILFRVPISEIFPGLTESVSLRMENRLTEFEEHLGEQSAHGPRASAIARKLEWLSERRSSGHK